MIVNEFLTVLDNRNTTFDGIYRDSYELKQFTDLRNMVWGAIFDNTNTSEHFRIACEIMLILRNSVIAPWEILGDSRLSYTDVDLAAALLGKGSSVTGSAHPLSFIVTEGTPSKQQWTITYDGGGSMTSVDEDGRTLQVTGLSFSPTVWTAFDLVGKQGKAQVLNEPTAGDTWTVTRDENYNSQVNAIAQRLNDLSVDSVIPLLPTDLIGLYRSTPVLQGPLRVAAAAAGVVYGP